MPSHSFVCGSGHVTEHYTPPSEQRPDTVPCSCGAPARYDVTATFRGHWGVMGDGFEHFHEGLGMAIRGNSHLRRVQKERGCHDWEPDSKLTPATVL